MTSDSCCIFGDQLFSRPLFVSTFACPSALSSHPRNRLDEGGEKVCVCVRVVCDRVSLIVTELGGPIKSSAGRAAPQTFFHPTLRSGAPPHTDFFFLRVMEQRTFREQLFFLVLCLSVLKGDSRYIEVSKITCIQISLLLFCT